METKIADGYIFVKAELSEVHGLMHSKLKNDDMASRLEERLTDRRAYSYFSGKAKAMLEGMAYGLDDMSNHERLAQEFACELGDFAAQETNAKFRRRLRASDEDGEFVFARRFDDKPFLRSIKERVPTKMVEVRISMAIPVSTKTQAIDKYAAIAWVIVNLLESKGINTSVCLFSHSLELSRSGLNIRQEVSIKKSDEYLNASVMAAVVSSNFYRRAFLGLHMIACDNIGEVARLGLGTPQEESSGIAYHDGVLTLSPQVGKLPIEEISAELQKVLK